MGSIALHGGHHSAEKSTSTGRSVARTDSSKVWSLRTLDSWSRVDLGGAALLDACLDPTVQRILLIDYPAVVGLSAGAALAPVIVRLRADIGTAAEVGGNPCRIPLEPLAHMLCGAIQEGALLIAASPHPRQERRAVGETTGFLLTAIREQLQAC